MKVKIFPSVINGSIIAPPSKSYTHRAIIIASLAKGKSVIRNPLISNDTKATIGACKLLGAKITVKKQRIEITGVNGQFPKEKTELTINCRQSGTTIRFMTAIAALSPSKITLTGEKRMRERPIGDLVNTLKSQGINIRAAENNQYPPVILHGGILHGGNIIISGKQSSQFVSALLLIAPFAVQNTILTVNNLKSAPYIDITIDMMRLFGVRVKKTGSIIMIKSHQSYKARDYTVEGDYSSASYFFAASAVTKSRITVHNLNPDTLQGDKYFLDILHKMGCDILKRRNSISVYGKSLRGIDVDCADSPDIVPSLSICAAKAGGVTKIINIGHLRIKETDRIKALGCELSKMNIRVSQTQNSLQVTGGNLIGTEINTYNDHRMAMSFAVAGLTASNKTIINNAEVVDKSYPEFWNDLMKIGAKIKFIKKSNFNSILLHGFRCTGKSTIGKILAEKLHFDYMEMDDLIVKQAGKSIDNLTDGGTNWQEFRRLENILLKKLLKKKNTVVSTGGGLAVNNIYKDHTKKTFGDLNIKSLRSARGVLSIILTSSNKIIGNRIRKQELEKVETKRPLLDINKAVKIKLLLKRYKDDDKKRKQVLVGEIVKDSLAIYRTRKPLYNKISRYIIDTGKLTIDESIKKIINIVELNRL